MKLTKLKRILAAALVAVAGVSVWADDAPEEEVVAFGEAAFWLGGDEITVASGEAAFWFGPDELVVASDEKEFALMPTPGSEENPREIGAGDPTSVTAFSNGTGTVVFKPARSAVTRAGLETITNASVAAAFLI